MLTLYHFLRPFSNEHKQLPLICSISKSHWIVTWLFWLCSHVLLQILCGDYLTEFSLLISLLSTSYRLIYAVCSIHILTYIKALAILLNIEFVLWNLRTSLVTGVTVFLCGIAIAVLRGRCHAPSVMLANFIATPIEIR